MMQLMPNTALELRVDDIFDPVQNVEGGVRYLTKMLEMFKGDLRLALAGYNAGPSTVERYGRVPPYTETRRYIQRVLKYYARYRDNDEKVDLKIGEGDRPSPDYLPRPTASTGGPVVYLTNGLTMRGKEIVRTKAGIRVMMNGGWIMVPHEAISSITGA